MIKKGIILAGGKGSRLSPLTKVINKQLLPLYDKPLIFYPLSILMLAGIRDILIITNPGEEINFKKILGNGSNFGIKIKYTEQSKPNGLPEAFILGEKFINKQNIALILGDNFFYGQGFTNRLKKKTKFTSGATIFTYQVNNPEDYGTDNSKDPDGSLDGMPTEGEIKEKFESKAQQGLFWARCNKCSSKDCKWCKMAKEFSDSTSKKDYETMPDKKTNESTQSKKPRTQLIFNIILQS
jgi:glucose-1-phosphate thymidylyltransferase short form